MDKTIADAPIEKSDLTTPSFRHDIAVTRTLAHPNIATFQDVITSNNRIVPLTESLRKREVEPAVQRSYFRQLLDVLNFCHRQGLHHRNLHADLLFVDNEGFLKVTGFGATGITRSVYSAPEVITGKDYDGEKIDAWACGVILHLLVTGSMPDPVLLHRGEYDCSEVARGLIPQLLAVDPSKRLTLSEALQHRWLSENESERKTTSSRVDFKELINDALPGRSDAVVDIFAAKLARLDIEHRDDLKLLASLFRSPDRLAVWLEEKSRLPAFASLRLARYMFKY